MTDRKPIREAVYQNFSDRREVAPAIWGSDCAGCGVVFTMKSWCNDNRPSEIQGTFDRGAADKDGRGLGNMFSATVCGFACADKVMKGGWRDIERYKPFAEVDAVLVRCELTVTALVAKGEKEILAQADESRRGATFYDGTYRAWDQPRSVMALVDDLKKHEESLAKIKALADRTGMTGDVAADVLWIEEQLVAALEVIRKGGRPGNGGSITIGVGGMRDSTPAWTPDAVLGRLADAAGLLAAKFPAATGAGRLSRFGWRLTREAIGEKSLLANDLLDLLHECEQLERDDAENLDEDSENYQKHDVADRAEDGLSIAKRLVELAERKLSYTRVLKDDDEKDEEG